MPKKKIKQIKLSGLKLDVVVPTESHGVINANSLKFGLIKGKRKIDTLGSLTCRNNRSEFYYFLNHSKFDRIVSSGIVFNTFPFWFKIGMVRFGFLTIKLNKRRC